MTHGIPQAIYCDWKNVYQRRATPRETLEGIAPETQFGGMCAKLGIELIPASSPEAKGRVERHHGTHQDRLVKKMRLLGIADYEAANVYLDERYLVEHNERFAREPAAAASYHVKLRRRDLRAVFCLEQERVVSRDWVVRYQNRWLQLRARRNQAIGAGTRVTIQQWRDGSVHVVHEGRQVAFEEIAKPEPKKANPRIEKRPPTRVTPAANHPWRRSLIAKKRAANL